MIKAILSDFSRVILRPKNREGNDSMGRFHREMQETEGYRIFDYFELNAELLDFYRSLKGRYPIYMFTTSFLEKEPEIARQIEGIFDRILVTHEMGLHKKEPSSYVTVARELGYQPEEILYIDDTPHRAAAAEAAGMKVVLFTTNAEAIPEIEKILNILR